MMYYRFSNSTNPMSDWGHAMFSDNADKVEHYGAYKFVFDGVNAVAIDSLYDTIINYWTNCQESGNFGDMCDSYFENLAAEDVFTAFNPADIVNSADGWDSALVGWFWEFVAEPNNIMAITTQDGAIVFDSSLIVKED